MAEFLQYVVNGLIAGSAYGLLALAMTLIYGILTIPNFALGAIYALGAFISFYVIQWMGPAYYLLSLFPGYCPGRSVQGFSVSGLFSGLSIMPRMPPVLSEPWVYTPFWKGGGMSGSARIGGVSFPLTTT